MMGSDDVNQPRELIPEARIKARIIELAHEINQQYQGQEITAVCVLKGSFIFFSDLIRQLNGPMTCEFLGVLSYPNTSPASGEVKITLDINEPLENKNVLVIEDLVHTGLTLSYIMNSLRARKPASLRSCALLVKAESFKAENSVDYVGFTIGQEFVVGYGIDFSGKFRGLPYVGTIEHGH